MEGITMSVRKVAMVNPKMMVQASGPQNATLSPPKWMLGLNSLSRVPKLMLKPMARGISPEMVDTAVRITGVMRVAPA